MLPTPMKSMAPAQGQPMTNRPAAAQAMKVKKPMMPKLNQALAAKQAGQTPQMKFRGAAGGSLPGQIGPPPQSVLGGARLLPQQAQAGQVRANAARGQMEQQRMMQQRQMAERQAAMQQQQMGAEEEMGPPPEMQEMGGMEGPPPMAMEDPGMAPPPQSLVPQEQMGGMPGLPQLPGMNRLPGNWNPQTAFGKLGGALGRGFRGFSPFGGR